MRLAIIDLGTNSVRFDVVQFSKDGLVAKLHREKLMIRLGEHVFLRQRLDPHSIQICLEAFESFSRTIREFSVHRVVAFGTSALREARDGERLIQKIKKRSGISVRIISGDEEARLISKGVLANEQFLRGRFALVDIGGGSTEVTICSGRKVLKSASFALGTARLQQVFLKTIPPDLSVDKKKGSRVENLRRYIRGVLLYRLVAEDWPKVSRIVGSSGTIRMLSRISKRETGSERIEKPFLDHLVKRMMTMTRQELLKVLGMEARRVDMILGGAILLQECMSAVHADCAETTEFSLRDGILAEQVEFYRSHHMIESKDLLTPFLEVANKFAIPRAETRQAIRISESVFDFLKPVHELDLYWKNFLSLACFLLGVGRFISPVKFEEHSSYLVKNFDISAADEWERKLLSELCLHHRQAKVLKKEAPFKKNLRQQKIFFKLLALLRIASALSYQRSKPIKIEKAVPKGRTIRLLISKRYSPDLEVLRADQSKQIFEEVFRKQLVFELV